MAFDYDKIKAQEEGGGGHWATYSDLFMVLSLVFLLLYVVSSLRTGTMGIQQYLEYQRLSRENADLQEQIRVYNTLKDDYLQTGSSEEELQSYENLMSQLVLLQDEAREESKRLSREAEENAQKEQALNEYQQMVRNIINTNLVSQARVQQRQRVIDKKDDIIEVQQHEVAQLQDTVRQKESALQSSQQEMQRVSQELDSRVKELQEAYQNQEISKANMERQVAELRAQNQKKLQELEQQSQSLAAELQHASQNLKVAQTTIQAQGTAIASLVEQTTNYSEQMKNLQSQYERERQQERADFEKRMSEQQLSAQARAQQEAEFRKQAQQKEQELAQQLGQLQGKVQQSQADLDRAMAAKIEAESAARGLAEEAAQLSEDLEKMREVAEARERLTQEIKDSLAKAGVKAEVDGQTGDVILSFGEEYFDTGQANLKPGMKDILKRFMPIYAEKLMADPSVAEKVRKVEIIGFASPTYRGRFVDPVSLEAKDREAVNYNLDLSYYRARSIFEHIFDTGQMTYQYQQDLLPKVSVTGRSFLSEEVDGDRVPAGMSVSEYCAKHNCEQAQRVIIRFDMQP